LEFTQKRGNTLFLYIPQEITKISFDSANLSIADCMISVSMALPIPVAPNSFISFSFGAP
jgi:hypothetical protein